MKRPQKLFENEKGTINVFWEYSVALNSQKQVKNKLDKMLASLYFDSKGCHITGLLSFLSAKAIHSSFFYLLQDQSIFSLYQNYYKVYSIHNFQCLSNQLYLLCMIKRHQNYRQEEEQEMAKSKEFAKTALFFNNQYPRGFNGDTWDAKHLSSFLNRSNYSNWKGNQANISRMSHASHRQSYSSTQGNHFFKTTKDNKNQSKIGFTPIFPLVSNIPVVPAKQVSLRTFFNSSEIKRNDERAISGRSIKLRCNPQEKFKFEGNALKFQATDPITMSNEQNPFEAVNGFRKQRMNRLISSRHPHGMTGIDHPENPQTQYYSVYEEKTKVREEPNTHNSFLLDREWNSKKRSVPPVDQWKNRKSVTVRFSRNQNVHGYNIITNRYLAQ